MSRAKRSDLVWFKVTYELGDECHVYHVQAETGSDAISAWERAATGGKLRYIEGNYIGTVWTRH